MAGGGSKPGERRGGRKHGTPNRASTARQAEVAASGITPLDYMLAVLLHSGFAGPRHGNGRRSLANTLLEIGRPDAPHHSHRLITRSFDVTLTSGQPGAHF